MVHVVFCVHTLMIFFALILFIPNFSRTCLNKKRLKKKKPLFLFMFPTAELCFKSCTFSRNETLVHFHHKTMCLQHPRSANIMFTERCVRRTRFPYWKEIYSWKCCAFTILEERKFSISHHLDKNVKNGCVSTNFGGQSFFKLTANSRILKLHQRLNTGFWVF